MYRLPMKIDALCVLREDSSLIAATGEPWVVSLAVENRLVRNYLDGSPVFILNRDNRMYLWLLSPVLRDRAVIGFLAMAVQLDRTFLRPLESATGARVMLSLRNQAFVSTGLLDSVTIHILSNYYRRAFDSRSLAAGRVGTLVYRAAIIPSLPELYAYVFLDTVELQNLLRQYSLFSILFLLLVLVIGFALAALIYRLTFLKPLTLFMEGVKRVAAGDLAYTLSAGTEDEFGDLSRAFTHMTRSLRSREHEIAELGRLNALILTNVPSGLLTLDLEGRVSGFNPRLPSLLRLAEGALRVGRPVGELPVEKGVLDTLRAALEREEYVSRRDVELPAAEGGRCLLSLSTSPFLSGDDARIGVLVVVLDVTKERTLEEKLAVSGRMAAMGEMVAGVAHQIRNPLAIMKVSAQMLRDASPCGRRRRPPVRGDRRGGGLAGHGGEPPAGLGPPPVGAPRALRRAGPGAAHRLLPAAGALPAGAPGVRPRGGRGELAARRGAAPAGAGQRDHQRAGGLAAPAPRCGSPAAGRGSGW